jgi:hypothetical protein
MTAINLSHPAETLRGRGQSSYISIQSIGRICQQPGMGDWRGFAPTWRYIQLYGLPEYSG